MSGTYLVTQFHEKDQVKALGARWDPARKQWYVPEGRDLAPFAPWLPAVASLLDPAESGQGVSVPSWGNSGQLLAVGGAGGISLSQLLAGVAQLVASAYREGVWTTVEVVDTRLRGGHVYLEVSERDERGTVVAKSNAVIWANVAERVLPEFERATGAQLGPGIKLLVRARPVFKPQYGFSLEIDGIDAGYTLGDLEARKRDIRDRLQREGLWESNRRLPPPWDYQHVVVVAPEGAAGLGDFQAEASRLQSFGVCQFTYAYSRFQGEGAAAQIRLELLSALEQISANHAWRPDAVVIIRGGGAVNDLAWLNDYELARCLCELDVPVLTGIGHERDSTVLDEVAHQAFDTPSKVIAGIERTVLQRVREAQAAFDEIRLQAFQVLRESADSTQQALSEVRHLAVRQVQAASRSVPVLLADIRAATRQTVRTARADVAGDWRSVRERAVHEVRLAREEVRRGRAEVATMARQSVLTAREHSQALMREIAGQGPEKTLNRGFALVRDVGGGAMTSAHGTALAGSAVRIQFRDGVRHAVLGEEESP